MKFGFVCLQVPGHLNPLTALARHLQMRGHDVVFLYSSGAAGLPFIPGEEERILSENRAEMSKKQGDEALKFSMGLIMSQSESMIKSLPAIVRSNQIDALIIDCINYYVELAALQLGIPYIHVSAAAHFDYSGHTPLMFYGWPHETSAAALARNRDGAAKFIQMLNETNDGIRAHAAAAGLEIDWDNPHATLSPWASISQVPKAFDFETSHWPAQFHHTGPFHDGKGRESLDFPWDQTPANCSARQTDKKSGNVMKDSLSDRTADSQTAVSGRDSTSFTNLDGEARSIMSNVDTRSEAEPFSDAEKLVLLTHLYLELRLGVKQALRAADADLLTLFKGRTRRLMVKQPL